ncbi:MAG: deacetylase [Pirellulales bacterium]|nr:deacetylase [Pirellulales bacterium]
MGAPCPHALLITIDTEGDNLWSTPETITTRNSAFLGRFQSLCEKYGLKPTWLTNWEMARCPVFRELASDAVARGAAEIGMHLHAWNTPPLEPLTEDDFLHQPLLIHYPVALVREKIARLTDLLEDTFEAKMVSHRAGRWGLDETYARLLEHRGYLVDCTVTPHVSWRSETGDTDFRGCDYTSFPGHAYLLDLDDIRRPGCSALLEIPMSIVPGPDPLIARVLRRIGRKSRPLHRFADRFFPPQFWFRPNRHNGHALREFLGRDSVAQAGYLQFMMHSSELMPGGSPRFPTEKSIERLYETLEELFAAARTRFVGMTLAEYRRRFNTGHSESAQPAGTPAARSLA